MCVDTYSLSCVHFLLWTLIDSFVWNEIVHGISFGNSRWYHQYDAYSTPARWSRVTFFSFFQDCLVWPALLFYQWALKGWVMPLSSTYQLLLMRLWVNYVPLLKRHTSYFWGKADVRELYYWLASVSVGHLAGALAIICHWALLTWLTYAYGMLCQDDIAPGECLLLQCAFQSF